MYFVHLIPEKVFELIPSRSKWNSKFAVLLLMKLI